MSGLIAMVIAAVAGAAVAVVASFGVVSAVSPNVKPVDKPFVVYGSN